MIKGKVNLRDFELVKIFKPAKAKSAFITVPALILVIIFLIWWSYYTPIHMTGNSQFPVFYFLLAFLFVTGGLLGAVYLIIYILDLECVLVFREGIYIKTSLSHRFILYQVGYPGSGFIPWEHLKTVILMPLNKRGIIVAGENPRDFIAVPHSLGNHYDEIQGLIFQIKPPDTINIIDLEHQPREPVHAKIPRSVSIKRALQYVVPFLILFIFAITQGSRLEQYRLSCFGLIGIMAAIGVVFGLIKIMRGYFRYPWLFYRDGLYAEGEGKISFTLWEQIESVKRLGDGKYVLYFLARKIIRIPFGIEERDINEFEDIVRDAGKLQEP